MRSESGARKKHDNEGVIVCKIKRAGRRDIDCKGEQKRHIGGGSK